VPFTAADVTFTFDALYDPRVGSVMASSYQIAGAPIRATAVDDHTVRLVYPAPYGPGLSNLDSLPILPRHKLAAALAAGTLAGAWNLKTPLSEITGAGPFVLAEYVPGQRMRFTRNPQFWLRPLPYVDEIEVQIVPELNAQLLRLESGQADVTYDFARAEDMATLRQGAARGRLQIVEAGVDITPNALWFNLIPGAPHAKGRAWLQRDELRQAISFGVDRQTIIDTVYLGAAAPIYGPITPGHGEWYLPDLPKTPYDPAKAKALLAAIGLVDRNGDGILEDPSGRELRLSMLTVKGNTIREHSAAVIQEQLRKIGLTVDVAAQDLGQVIAQMGKGEYDTVYYALNSDTFDPARNLDFWMSSGTYHLWNPAQKTPATPWEARIDDLMRRQSTTLDPAERRRLFRDVQIVLAEHMPAVYFAAGTATVAMSARVHGAAPSVLKPSVLWDAESLSIAPPARR
jgi:peptide/nickel transport system substrate-binding protein